MSSLEEEIETFMKMSPSERWKVTPHNDKLLLLSLWGMRPGWQPPAEVLSAYGVTYTQTTVSP